MRNGIGVFCKMPLTVYLMTGRPALIRIGIRPSYQAVTRILPSRISG